MVAFIFKLIFLYLIFLFVTTLIRFWRTYRFIQAKTRSNPFSKDFNSDYGHQQNRQDSHNNSAKTSKSTRDVDVEYRVVNKKDVHR